MEKSKVETRKDVCAQCRFKESKLINMQVSLQCHLNPPQTVSFIAPTQHGPQVMDRAKWPDVPADGWCGQFQAALN